MVWYPSVDDVVCLNILVLDMTGDRHPHRLLGSREGIKAIVEKAKQQDGKGLTYQAAVLLKELAGHHPFAGGNHRTAYVVAKSFLLRNGGRLRVGDWKRAYPFIKDVESRTIEEIRRWIELGQEEDLRRES